MNNKQISKIFSEIADYLAMEDIPFKPQAYEKAALNLESLENDVAEIYKNGGKPAIEKIPRIGKSMAEKIIEYLNTGRVKEYEALKKKMPVELEELRKVEGVGPKKIKELYKKLKIKNVKDLENAAKDGKIRKLSNFGEKSEKNMLESIEFLKRGKGRFLLGRILPIAEEIIDKLKTLKEVNKISAAGSARRMKETIGDIDILITAKNPNLAKKESFGGVNKVMDFFVSLPGVVKIWGKGSTKSSIRMEDGFDVDLRVVPEKSFGSALQYFTGSKEHNIALRIIAQNKGYKLNEYGLFSSAESRRQKRRITQNFFGKSEKEIYEKLGMQWIPPEMRENRGEIELSQRHNLPKLIDYNDLKGDLHIHSNWDGGENSIEELAEAAIKMGYEYIGIADHTKYLKIEHGLDEKQLEWRNEEIDKLNKKFQVSSFKFQVLKGCEANIMEYGSIDIGDKTLAKLDFVIAGVHSHFKMTKEQMTKRLIRAMENPNVDIISHPTGRLVGERDEYKMDFDKVLEIAFKTKTILEINSFPKRLDLNDINIKKAVSCGVKLIINTDLHEKLHHLNYAKFGIAQARRGWAEKKDIINTLPLEKLLKFFQK